MFCLFRDGTTDAAREILAELHDLQLRFEDVGARVVGISSQIVERVSTFPMLHDADGEYLASFGLAAEAGAVACAILDRNGRLIELASVGNGADKAKHALDLCGAEARRGENACITVQAPVLVIPRVFEPAFCKTLIEYWSEGEKTRDQITRHSTSTRADLSDYEIKRRTDVVIPEGEDLVNVEIRYRLSMRVVPELEKTLNFRTSGYELARIGCYDGAEAGFFRPHRDIYDDETDNPRRFAMSANLNEDFEGGEVSFPEYGSQTYRPPSGGAVIFSCRLLHEALPVTRGKRYGLFLFFN